jgi:hypothetical protein
MSFFLVGFSIERERRTLYEENFNAWVMSIPPYNHEMKKRAIPKEDILSRNYPYRGRRR